MNTRQLFYKGKIKAIFLVAGSIVLFLFVGIVLLGGAARFYFDDQTLTLASLVKRIWMGEPIIQKSGGELMVIEKQIDGNTVKLTASSGAAPFGQAINFEIAEKSFWPKDAWGGVFELHPDGAQFKEALNLKITLAEIPKKDFSFGYWHPDTKKWEHLPTVWRDDRTFETVLSHASFPGGYQVELNPDSFLNSGDSEGGYDIKFNDRENQMTLEEIKNELKKIQLDQQTGEAAAQNDASWKRVWELVNELSNKVMADYCGSMDASTAHEFYVGWELAQRLGFNTIENKFVEKWENKCQDPTKESKFKVDQTDSYSNDLNLTFDLGMGSLNANAGGDATVYSHGFPVKKAKAGDPDWKTEWIVYQDMTYIASRGGSGHLEVGSKMSEGWMYLDIPNSKQKGRGSGRYMLKFDLSNIKEGDAFPISSTLVTDQTTNWLGASPQYHYIIKWGQFYSEEQGNSYMNMNDTVSAGAVNVLTGTLVKDKGERGAVINSSGISEAQKKELNRAQQAMGGMPPQLKKIYDDLRSGKTTQSKPIRIIRYGDIIEEEPDPEEDYKNEEEDLRQNRESTVNPNDKDGDGIPDLVSLPGN